MEAAKYVSELVEKARAAQAVIENYTQEQVDALRGLVPECYVVGDALRARQIGQATREGTDAVIDLGL